MDCKFRNNEGINIGNSRNQHVLRGLDGHGHAFLVCIDLLKKKSSNIKIYENTQI